MFTFKVLLASLFLASALAMALALRLHSQGAAIFFWYFFPALFILLHSLCRRRR
jgi:hypothetical protein